MSAGWNSIKLADAVEVLNGFAFKSSRYVPEGIRVIRISNVQKGYVEDKDPKFYPVSSKDEIRKYLLQEGDLLMSLTGNVGRVGLLPGSMLPCALNQRVACLRMKSAKLSKMFLFYLLNSNVFEAMCIKSSSGVAQLNMSTEWLKEQIIPLPSLPEQQRIVDILDQEFAKIDALKANAEKSLQAAKDLFHATLKKELEQKEGWEMKRITEIASLKAGKFVSAQDIFDERGEGMYPCFGGNGLRGYVKTYNHEGRFNIIGRQGALCGNINIADGKFHATEHAVVVSPIVPVIFTFLYYSLCNANINQYATGAAQPGISRISTNDYSWQFHLFQSKKGSRTSLTR